MENEDMIIVALAILILLTGSVCAYVNLNGITFTEPAKLNETTHVNQTVNTKNINNTTDVPPSDSYESGAKSPTGSRTSGTYSQNSYSHSVTPSQSSTDSGSQVNPDSGSDSGSDTPSPEPSPSPTPDSGGSDAPVSDGGSAE